jgi:hypothetical protein
MMRLLSCTLVLGLGLAGAGCNDAETRVREQKKRIDAERKAYQEAQEAKRKAAAPKIEVAQLEPFWGDSSYSRIMTGRQCPEGLGGLFPGAPTPADEATASKLRNATYVTVHSHGIGVTIGRYDPKKKALAVEVDGVVECFDSSGLLTVAWGEPTKPFRQPGDEDEDVLAQSVWRARPLKFAVPMRSPAEAKRFSQKEGLGLEARLVYQLGRVDVDSKVKKVPSADEGKPEDSVDWGAGRLIHVTLLGVRLAVDHEKTALIESRKPIGGTARSTR